MAAVKKAPVKKAKSTAKDLTAAQVATRLDKVVASTNDAITDLRDQVDSNQKSLMEALNRLSGPVNAKDVPTSFNTQRIEAAESDLGQAVTLSDEDNTMVEGTRLKDVQSPEFMAKAELLKFMQEPVTVHIHDNMSDETLSMFDISVNGRSFLFRFGETKTVPRYVVEGLARSKPIHYGNQQYKKSDGSDSVRNPARRGLRYPFSIEKDANPKGAQWVKTVLAQP